MFGPRQFPVMACGTQERPPLPTGGAQPCYPLGAALGRSRGRGFSEDTGKEVWDPSSVGSAGLSEYGGSTFPQEVPGMRQYPAESAASPGMGVWGRQKVGRVGR